MNKKFLNEVRRMQQLAGINPIDHNFVPIENVRLFCEDKITEQQFLAELNSELLEEGVLDWIKTNIIDKVINYYNSFLLSAYSLGWTILNKIKSFFGWLSGLISKFAKKYPFIFKLIIIGLITLILICVFCACAKAAATGTPIPKDEINAALGLVDKYQQHLDMHSADFENKSAIATKVHKVLIDLRDGKISNLEGLSGKVKEVTEYSLKEVKDLKGGSSQSTDVVGMDAKNLFQYYIKHGENVINYTYHQVPESKNTLHFEDLYINYKENPNTIK